MIKEIGSEFNIDVNALTSSDNVLDEYLERFHTIYTDSGRSAVKLALHMIDSEGTVLLPDYVCASVANCFKKNELLFYRINKDFTIDLKDLKKKMSDKVRILYLINYFGALNNVDTLQELTGLKQQYGFTIIEDTSHSFLSNPHTVGNYCVCSLRKWFPIPDGGVLYATKKMKDMALASQENSPYSAAKASGMVLKTLFLQNKYDYNEIYRRIFSDSEEELNRQEQIYPMSRISKYLLQFQDIEEIIKRRKMNYRRLAEGLSAISVEAASGIDDSDCPFCFPVFISRRDRMRSLLQENKVYCAVHWPAEDISLSDSKIALEMSGEILSLPLDQRYTADDMDRIVEVMKKGKGLL